MISTACKREGLFTVQVGHDGILIITGHQILNPACHAVEKTDAEKLNDQLIVTLMREPFAKPADA
jgi:hypothetical protein